MKVQIVGFGGIGKGLAEVLLKKRKELKERHGIDIKVVSISDITGTIIDKNGVDLKKALAVAKESGKIIKYPGARPILGLEAIESVEADVVVEVTPTNIKTGEPGVSHILKAIEKGKHVVTSNKGPLALKFRQLKNVAEKKGVELKYEATVGGAVPIINLAKQCLSGDRIVAIEGILNGTTNYILSRMYREESPFDIVLREAQEMGIAEADPSLDIDGIDTANKLLILANSLMDMNASYKDVKIEGIRKVTMEAVKLAKEGGHAIKLIGEVKNGQLEVAPQLVPINHPLNVDGSLNVVMFKADIAGEITIVGKGAGVIETNSAILSDIISIRRK